MSKLRIYDIVDTQFVKENLNEAKKIYRSVLEKALLKIHRRTALHEVYQVLGDYILLMEFPSLKLY